ncbi:MAG: type II toxin-antitoxin system VapC family toxin [Spirulina sp. DLM2.Bin59]|nr:MAG: type II toxin-antitoxin system VapC family toxin [Spirulina sp. DLM2.Bin59]
MTGIKFLLDTNVVIGFLKEYPGAIALLNQENLDFENCAISQITRMELLSYPQLQDDEAQIIQDFLDHLLILKIDDIVEQGAIQFRRTQRVKLPDAIIAATAQAYGLQLITLDQELATKFAQDSA